MKFKNSWKLKIAVALLALGVSAIAVPRTSAAAEPGVPTSVQQNAKYEAWLNNQVRHQLALDPWYGVFDVLGYSVNGTEVTLSGQVVYPGTKDAAVGAVKHIEGVTKVVDNIQLLPLSPMDNGIRRAEYRAIFSYAGLYRYAMGTIPSIHIIVDMGHVTLIGNVDNQSDAQMAYMRARMVPGVFSVTNNLKVG